MKSDSTKRNTVGLIHKLYNNFLRPILPHKISVHNGIPIKGYAKLFDIKDEFPEYESALISAIRSEIKPENKIVLVGGGWGISTVAAINATGQTGSVVTYSGRH